MRRSAMLLKKGKREHPEVILSTPTAVKFGGKEHWIYQTRVKTAEETAEEGQQGAPSTPSRKAQVNSCNSGSRRGTDWIAPAAKTRGETVQRGKTLTTPGHASRQQLGVPAGCPGPNRRGWDLPGHRLPSIQNGNIMADVDA